MRKLFKITLETEGRKDEAEGFYSYKEIERIEKLFPEDIEECERYSIITHCRLTVHEYALSELAHEICDYFLGNDLPKDSEKRQDRLEEFDEDFVNNPRKWLSEYLDSKHWNADIYTCEINPETDEPDNDFLSELLQVVFTLFWNNDNKYTSLGNLINYKEQTDLDYEEDTWTCDAGKDYEERYFYDEGEECYVKGWDIEWAELTYEGEDGDIHPEPYYSLRDYLRNSEYAKHYIHEVDNDEWEEMHKDFLAEKEYRENLGFKIIRDEHIILDFMPWLICRKKNPYAWENGIDYDFIGRIIKW